MPFVFQAMPSEAEMAELEAPILLQQSPKTSSALTIGAAESATHARMIGGVAVPHGGDEKEVATTASAIERAQTIDAHAPVEIAAGDLGPNVDTGQKNQRCGLKRSRLALLPFLMAFIG